MYTPFEEIHYASKIKMVVTSVFFVFVFVDFTLIFLPN